THAYLAQHAPISSNARVCRATDKAAWGLVLTSSDGPPLRGSPGGSQGGRSVKRGGAHQAHLAALRGALWERTPRSLGIHPRCARHVRSGIEPDPVSRTLHS